MSTYIAIRTDPAASNRWVYAAGDSYVIKTASGVNDIVAIIPHEDFISGKTWAQHIADALNALENP